MQPSRHYCLFASLAILLFLLVPPLVSAETLTITSSPPGAEIEIAGMASGNTPYRTDYPGGYFHKPHTVFSARLEHALTLKVSMEGYVTQQITMTEGPFEWVAVTGRHHGNYFLLRSDHFNVKLEPVALKMSDESSSDLEHAGPLRPAAEISLRTDDKPHSTQTAVVQIKSDPPDAEIYIDGKFVGETPSTLNLTSGTRHIELKAPGRKTWERDLEVLQDSHLTLHPTLDPLPQPHRLKVARFPSLKLSTPHTSSIPR